MKRTTALVSVMSKYGQRSQRAKLLRHLQLLVLNEVSILLIKLFALMYVLLREIRSSETKILPAFGRLTIVFVRDYAQLLSVVPRFYMKPETAVDGPRVYINILNERPSKSRL